MRGDRNVLVITGKGTRAEMERMRDFTVEERGVLRRLVPLWLGEPELRGMVISYTTAGPRHGGDGALYVRLRKLNRE
jgi:DNA-nicking Smr family endonuclease